MSYQSGSRMVTIRVLQHTYTKTVVPKLSGGRAEHRRRKYLSIKYDKPYCGNQFSLKTTLILADQLLHRFEALHSHDYLHRDVKPENFLLGLNRRGNVVYITDLGLAIHSDPEMWRPSGTPTRDVSARPPQLLGTCRYASINGHLGVGKWEWHLSIYKDRLT